MRPNSEILILVVDDKRGSREALQKMIAKEDFCVSVAHDAETALELFGKEPAHLVITDLRMPGMDGISLLKEVKRKSPETEVILISGHGTVEVAVEAMREGAYDFITKPLERVVVLKAISKAREKQELMRENADLRARLRTLSDPSGLIGNSKAMREVKELIRQVAPTSANVLILGESGTGKELVANAVQNWSDRAGKPFVKVNCAALPENLLESELFGYERGAFTGAVSRKEGRFYLADGGMLFLDEIGDMPMALQAKILRVLQEGEFERLGGNETIKVDVRIIAATNQDLMEAIAERRFREDLYYRLNVISITLPPLRERRSDIPLLVEHFIERFAAKNKQTVSGFSREAVEVMSNFDWPGNIRELENTVERAVVLGRDEVLTLDDLPPGMTRGIEPGGEVPVEAGAPVISIPVGTPLSEVEHRVILETLRHTGGDKSAAARQLGIATRTIYRKLDQTEYLKS